MGLDDYNFKETESFVGLVPEIMKVEGIKTTGKQGSDYLEVIDFTAVYDENQSGDTPDHEYVDLGLPSGTLWATCNVGANTPEENGLYFAWGETSGYTAEQVLNGEKGFAWAEWQDASGNTHQSDYKFGPYDENDHENHGMTKYNNTDGLTELEPSDDAATANWGSNWSMPTSVQCQELLENTTSAFTEVNGVNGLLLTSTANTNTLFFAAAGTAGKGGVKDMGEFGGYWSSSLGDESVSNAFFLNFGDGGSGVDNDFRCFGFSVRPVVKNQ